MRNTKESNMRYCSTYTDRGLDQILSRALSDLSGLNWGDRAAPPVDVLEDDSGYRIQLEVPGFTREEIEVSVEKQQLTISGEHEVSHPDGTTVHRRERRDRRFRRSFQLSKWVDTSDISASLEGGILDLRLGKKPDAEPTIQQIEIL